MEILPIEIYRFNAIPIKIPTKLFTDLERTILNLVWENIKHRIAKIFLHIKELLETSLFLTSSSIIELQ